MQLTSSCTAAAAQKYKWREKARKTRKQARRVVKWQSDGQAQRTRTVKIMTRRVADYLSLQSPTPTAEKHRVLLVKTGAQ